jgi:penicillin-binding protein 1B
MDSGATMPILTLEPEEIMQFFGPERARRQLISIEQVPENLTRAVLAAEDHRFFQHYGVDLRGIFRALMTDRRHRCGSCFANLDRPHERHPPIQI